MCNTGQSNFRKLFKEYTGQYFIDYRNTVRIHEAKKLIDNEVVSKAEVAYLCGFNNMSFFIKYITDLTKKQRKIIVELMCIFTKNSPISKSKNIYCIILS